MPSKNTKEVEFQTNQNFGQVRCILNVENPAISNESQLHKFLTPKREEKNRNMKNSAPSEIAIIIAATSQNKAGQQIHQSF